MNVPAEEIISKVRDIMPARPVKQGEAFILAETQANRLLKLLGVTNVPIDVARICDLPQLNVRVEPRHTMPAIAGFSRHKAGGTWLVVVNKNDDRGERRVTLAHEFKHILDHTVHRVAYVHFGFGDKEKHDEMVERICEHFAGCLLMPRLVLKKVWNSGIQNTEALADFFEVPEEAMVARLRYLGLIDDGVQPIKEYFRRAASDIPIWPSTDLVASLA